MWQEGSGPAITEFLINAVSALGCQLPVHPGGSASLSHCGECGLQFLSCHSLQDPSILLRSWGLKVFPHPSAQLLIWMHSGLLGPWTDLEGAKFPQNQRESPSTLSLALPSKLPSRWCRQWLDAEVVAGDGGTWWYPNIVYLVCFHIPHRLLFNVVHLLPLTLNTLFPC